MFGDRLRKLLEAKNVTINHLCEYCEVSVQTGYKWLRDIEPRAKMKDRIAQYFGVSVQDLQFGPLPLLAFAEVSKRANRPQLDYNSSIQAADLIIITELKEAQQRSKEHLQGLKDHLVFAFSGTSNNVPYPVGTCQRESYDAGVERAVSILSKITL